MNTHADLSYSIVFDVPKEGQIEVSKFADGMQDCLMALEEINHCIVKSIDSSIQVISYIEELKAGSVEFKCEDKVKEDKSKKADQLIEITGAVLSALQGDYAPTVVFALKQAKECIFEINNTRLEKIEKKQKMYSAIEKILKDSNLNSDLKDFYLDSKALNKAVDHFYKGVQKTNNSVFYKSETIPKTHINAEYFEPYEENKLSPELQNENIVIDTYMLLTPTSKENCLWEFNDEDKKIKCKMTDIAFFEDYKSNRIKLGGNEKMKIQMKVQTFLDDDKLTKEYQILKVLEVIKEKGLFDK